MPPLINRPSAAIQPQLTNAARQGRTETAERPTAPTPIQRCNRLRGIPRAHRYEVNGRTPLDWLTNRYHVVQDRPCGIVNDPNAWLDRPDAFLAAIECGLHVSVETTRIVEGLPRLGTALNQPA